MFDLVLSCFVVLDQWSQTRGPHVAHEGVLCGPQCILGFFK